MTVSVIVCVNHMPKLPMSQKNKSHTTVKLGFFNLCTTPWAAAHFFLTENAVSKKPLQANGQTWVAISC